MAEIIEPAGYQQQIASLDKRVALLEQAFISQGQVASQTLEEIKGMRSEMKAAATMAAIHNARLTSLVGEDGNGGIIRALWRNVDGLRWRMATALGAAMAFGVFLRLMVEWVHK